MVRVRVLSSKKRPRVHKRPRSPHRSRSRPRSPHRSRSRPRSPHRSRSAGQKRGCRGKQYGTLKQVRSFAKRCKKHGLIGNFSHLKKCALFNKVKSLRC